MERRTFVSAIGVSLIAAPLPAEAPQPANRMPSIGSTGYAESGGLVDYGVNFSDLFRGSMTYVDKILKGAKPADLPIEQSSKFELSVNRKTAKALGVTIPPSVLARADRVIE